MVEKKTFEPNDESPKSGHSQYGRGHIVINKDCEMTFKQSKKLMGLNEKKVLSFLKSVVTDMSKAELYKMKNEIHGKVIGLLENPVQKMREDRELV